jgi:hypothetical protein
MPQAIDVDSLFDALQLALAECDPEAKAAQAIEIAQRLSRRRAGGRGGRVGPRAYLCARPARAATAGIAA